MARPFNGDVVSNEIRRRVAAAWGMSIDKVFERPPATTIALPYAIVILNESSDVSPSAQCVAMNNTYTIVGVFPWAIGEETFQKVDKANDLFEQLYNGQRRFYELGDPDEPDLGIMSKNFSVSFGDIGEDQNRSLEIVCSFSIRPPGETQIFS